MTMSLFLALGFSVDSHALKTDSSWLTRPYSPHHQPLQFQLSWPPRSTPLSHPYYILEAIRPACMPFLKVLSSCPRRVLHKLPLLLITFFPTLFICMTCSFSSWRCHSLCYLLREAFLDYSLKNSPFVFLYHSKLLFFFFNITLTFLLGCLIGNSNLPSPKLIFQLSHFDLPPSFNSG